MLTSIISQTTCPACGHHVAVSFFDGGAQPLATIAWPETESEARAMPRLPLTFVRCVDCGHIYNRDFDYAHVPYSNKPNLMFNRGSIWAKHLEKVAAIINATLPENPVVVEIGCGEGHLLRRLAAMRSDGKFIGFDPNANIATADRVEARQELFIADKHLESIKPDIIISRHVLEHLMNPLGFVQALAFAAEWATRPVSLYLEVPCINRVFESRRVVDFYYEHNSHFTVNSFTRLLEQCSSDIELIETGYNEEVVFGLATLGRGSQRKAYADEAQRFAENARQAKATIGGQLADLHASGKKVAIWGGTGKAAAFMHFYGVDAERFPLVVDSDQEKVGTFVPGTGQRICFRDVLLEGRPDVIIIPTQWRAVDIVAEINQCGIKADSVMLEYRGKLVDYHSDEHPYR
jgi:hypothetical protein